MIFDWFATTIELSKSFYGTHNRILRINTGRSRLLNDEYIASCLKQILGERYIKNLQLIKLSTTNQKHRPNSISINMLIIY